MPINAIRLSDSLRLRIGRDAVELEPRQAFHLGESLIRLATRRVVEVERERVAARPVNIRKSAR